MKQCNLLIIKGTVGDVDIPDDHVCLHYNDLKPVFKGLAAFGYLFKYRSVTLNTYGLDVLNKPFYAALLVRILSRGKCFLADQQGNKIQVTLMSLFREALRAFTALLTKKQLLEATRSCIDDLSNQISSRPSSHLRLDKPPAYLRTDLWFGIKSGGSVGHIAGVLNNLQYFSGAPVFITTDVIPTVQSDIETHIVHPRNKYWNCEDVLTIAANNPLMQTAETLLAGTDLGFVYQRSSLNNFTGVSLSAKRNIPFVLEYNGSEVWINRNWGTPLKYEELSEKIEDLNFFAADVIVVVSKPMLDELVERGVDADKILVNPNGVDPEKYHPQISGESIRSSYELTDKTVVGFIGTFGKWHGAEVLADAFGRLLSEKPEYKENVRLLMIGDGVTMPEVKAHLEKWGVADCCVLTGMVPQEKGPDYLAACDILASPHVPNSDGTPFFGSPTKLFEYMAMGKGIVASDLDQVGEVLEHERTAWMVEPGSAESLAAGLKVLIVDQALRQRLGIAAHEEVVAKYTWKEHTRRIIDKLRERCPEA